MDNHTHSCASCWAYFSCDCPNGHLNKGPICPDCMKRRFSGKKAEPKEKKTHMGAEPWRCGHCQQLIYNVESKDEPGSPLVPADGPVIPPEIRVTGYGSLCRTCADLYRTLTLSQYFERLEKESGERFKRCKSQGNNY